MSKGITLSKKYGVNPSVQVCPICGRDTGKLVLFGDNYRDKDGKKAEAPRQIAMPGEHCDRCQAVLDQGGYFFISVRDGEQGKENPYRTGKLCALKEEAAKRIFKDCKRVNYIEDTLYEHIFGAEIARMKEQEQQSNPEQQ